MIEQEIAKGLAKGGFGGITFLALVESLNITDMLYQLLLSLGIILIQAFLIPLIKFGFNKLKERIKSSKQIEDKDKDDLTHIVDKVSDKVTDKINDVAEDLKDNIKEDKV